MILMCAVSAFCYSKVQFDRVNVEICLEEPLAAAFRRTVAESWPISQNCRSVGCIWNHLRSSDSGVPKRSDAAYIFSLETTHLLNIRQTASTIIPPRQVLVRMCQSLYPSQDWNRVNLSLPELVEHAFPDIMAISYCPKIGFFNHSCCPNVVVDFRWNSDDDTNFPGVVAVVSQFLYSIAFP